jgi:hypothetical protein
MGVPGFDSTMKEVSHARPSQWSNKLINNKRQRRIIYLEL